MTRHFSSNVVGLLLAATTYCLSAPHAIFADDVVASDQEPTAGEAAAATPGVEKGQPNSQDQQAEKGQVSRWVRQLDSDQFVTRETATLNLIDAGVPSIGLIASALDGKSLEVTTRGIYVLRELALSNNLDTQDAAQMALERVAAADAVSPARRASETLRTLSGIRQQRALAELRELGARVSTSVRQIGFQAAEVTAIDVDDAWRGDVDDLRRLKWLSDVQQITFQGRHITDDFLEYVGQMKGLTSVVIKRTEVTSKGLRYLVGLEGLRELDVKYSPVDDESIQAIRNFKQLGIVKLYGTKVSTEAAKSLELALPEAEIDHRRGAFLGVACEQPPAACSVVQVVPNTAAARAGIVEGDVIVSYDGKRVDDFNGLKKLIGTNEPGESVDIQVARGGSQVRRSLPAKQRDAVDLDQCKQHPLGVEFKAVGAGAVAAGFRDGDVVRRVDGLAVTSLDELRQALAKAAKDEDSQIEVYRNARVVQKRVTFGEWD